MKQVWYRQCVLSWEGATLVAWIEERGAEVGMNLTLEDAGDPNRVWKVIGVSDARISKDEALVGARKAHTFKQNSSIAS